MTLSKGLDFFVVVLFDVGHMPAKGQDDQEAARDVFLAARRATQRLVIGVGGDGGLQEICPVTRHSMGCNAAPKP